MLKKSVIFIVLILVNVLVVFGQESTPTPNPSPNPSQSPYSSHINIPSTFNGRIYPLYVPQEIIVRFKEDPGFEEKEIIKSKFPSLDILNQKYQVTFARNIFSLVPEQDDEVIDEPVITGVAEDEKEPPSFSEGNLPRIVPFQINHENLNIYKLQIGSGNIEDAIYEFSRNEYVIYAEPNYINQIKFTPNDPLFPQQWAHKTTRAESGWDIERGNSGAVIAIIDTGVAYNHEDLQKNMFGNCTDGCPEGTGYDFVDINTTAWTKSGRYSLIENEDYTGPDKKPYDRNGHGTHVAGIAAARGNNKVGVSGVCQKCKIMPLRAGFSIKESGQTEGLLDNTAIIKAIYYAADNGADIISMSFGSYGYSTSEYDALKYAYDQGLVLIAASGNEQTDSKLYPAAFENVIAVSATDKYDEKAWFSNYGGWVDIAAPGDYILSTVPKKGVFGDSSGYKELGGTSMATPYVAGLAGLILSKDRSLRNEEVAYILKITSNFPEEKAYFIGTGRVNVKKALELDSLPEQLSTITEPQDAASITESVDIKGNASGKSYQVYYGKGIYPDDWIQIGSGIQANGILAHWNIEAIKPNFYTLRLRADYGNLITNDYKYVEVDKNLYPGWPVEQYDIGHFTFFDLNHDGIKEIISSIFDGVNIYNTRGNFLAGWRIEGSEGHYIYSSPTVTDLNHDGYFDIILGVYGGWDIDEKWIRIRKPGYLLILSYESFRLKKSQMNQVPEDDGHFLSSPVLKDIDGDGYDEIIISSSAGYVYIYKYDGTLFPGWPQKFPEILNTYVDVARFPYSNPVVGDINGDGEDEIVVGSMIGKVYAFKMDGSYLPGWPKNLKTDGFAATPVLGDVDGNGDLEIVVSERVRGKLYVLNEDSIPLSGWPYILDIPITSNGVALGDLDNDGKLEIAVGTEKGLYVFNSQGKILSGFPVLTNSEISVGNSPVIADVNGDGYLDFAVSGSTYNSNYGYRSFVAFIDKQGKIFWKRNMLFPKIYSEPVIDDIDNDGDLEVGAIPSPYWGDNAAIYLWSFDNTFASSVEWPMFQHDIRHTGIYTATNVALPLTSTFIRGDSNNDGIVDLTDAIFILNYLFQGGDAPSCQDAADVNDDGILDISDAVAVLQYLFLGGNDPAQPYPDEGIDFSEDGLIC